MGVLFAGGGLALFFRYPATHRLLLEAARHHRLAAVLAAVNLIWVTALLHDMAWSRFEPLKPLLFVLAPVAWFAIIRYMDELLAPRMIGGFILLLATPVLDAARWNPSVWRLVVVSLVYVAIVWGMVLVLSPFRYRHTVERLTGNPVKARLTGVVLMLCAVFHLATGITIF